MPDPSFFGRMKERKLVQWSLAYAAGGWAALEASDVVAGLFDWSTVFVQTVAGIVVAGFLVTLVVAWYHGDKGRQRVSGPELLILAMLLSVAGIGLALLSRTSDGPEPTQVVDDPALGTSTSPGSRDPRPSLAVLPFQNRAAPEDEAFVDGVFDEVLTHLSQETGLRLASRTSVEALSRAAVTMGQIADTLGVLYVLEGAIQIEDDRVRLNLQLIDAANEAHVWRDLDDRVLQGEELGLQTKIAVNAAQRILYAVTQAEWDRFGRISTDNDRAYELYRRHRTAIRSTDDPRPYVERVEDGIGLLEEAIDLDPGFGWAYAFLGAAYTEMYLLSEPSDEYAARAREALDRAANLVDERGYLAWFMAPYYRDIERDYDRAIQECDLIETTLNRSAGLYLRAGIERRAGRWFEALETLGRATAAYPTAYDGQWRTAETYHMMRRYDRALAHYDSALALDPDYGRAAGGRALLLWQRDGDAGPWFEVYGGQPWWQHMYEGDWIRALEMRQGNRTTVSRYYVSTRSLARGLIYLSARDSASASQEFQEAVDTLLARLETYPDDDRVLRSLGVAYALTGRGEEAVAAGRRALEIMPPERDALIGAESLATMAQIYGAVGPADSAMAYLDHLFLVPGNTGLSARAVSAWVGIDLIRADPRFGELLGRHGIN